MAKRKRKARRKKSRKSSLKRIIRKLRRFVYKNIKVFVLVLCAIIAVVYVKDLFNKNEANRITVNSRDYNGIDISKYQGNIDWGRVAKDPKIQFVYIKASEGASNVDSKYQRNISRAQSAGIKVGSYHYFIGRKSAREQFNNFNRYVKLRDQDLIPMVDVEEAGNSLVSRKQLQDNLKEFMELIKDEYGKYPLLYSQYRFYNEKLAPEFNKYFIFIARYSSKEPTLKGGGKYNIWQYSEKGRIDGISGTVDLDRFENGTTLSDIEL